jgi:membrane protease YdiL (CAAX protease family)
MQALFALPDGSGIVLAQILFVCAFAPIAEEMFFCGWLWTALNPSWGMPLTLAWTIGLWLVMHAPEGLWRPLVLLPSGLRLGLTRHYGASVRALLWLHVLNNSFATVVQVVAVLAARAARCPGCLRRWLR